MTSYNIIQLKCSQCKLLRCWQSLWCLAAMYKYRQVILLIVVDNSSVNCMPSWIPFNIRYCFQRNVWTKKSFIWFSYFSYLTLSLLKRTNYQLVLWTQAGKELHGLGYALLLIFVDFNKFLPFVFLFRHYSLLLQTNYQQRNLGKSCISYQLPNIKSVSTLIYPGC